MCIICQSRLVRYSATRPRALLKNLFNPLYMTLSWKSRFVSIALLVVFAALAFFLFGNQRHAEAQSLGGQIVCSVFTDLNQVGTPLPPLDADCLGGDPEPPPPPPPPPPVLPGACLDGIDNDGDGLIDWMPLDTPGGDPGCETPLDTDESNSPPPPPPPDDDDDSPILPTLTVIKIVINDNGGVNIVGDFPLFVGSTTVVSGATTTLAAGTYVVSETGMSSYTASFSGDCDSSGNVSLAAGDVKTCTITNNDVAPTSPPPGNGGGGGGGGGGGSLNLGQILGVATTTITAPLVCDPYLKSFIKFGATNNSDDVQRLQTFFNQLEGASLAVTGVYDQPTQTAVRSFQSKHLAEILAPWGIKAPTGYVYLTTRKKINEIHCNSTFPLTSNEESEIARVRGQVRGVTYVAPSIPGPGTPPATPSLPSEVSLPVVEEVGSPRSASLIERVSGFLNRLIGRGR